MLKHIVEYEPLFPWFIYLTISLNYLIIIWKFSTIPTPIKSSLFDRVNNAFAATCKASKSNQCQGRLKCKHTVWYRQNTKPKLNVCNVSLYDCVTYDDKNEEINAVLHVYSKYQFIFQYFWLNYLSLNSVQSMLNYVWWSGVGRSTKWTFQRYKTLALFNWLFFSWLWHFLYFLSS